MRWLKEFVLIVQVRLGLLKRGYLLSDTALIVISLLILLLFSTTGTAPMTPQETRQAKEFESEIWVKSDYQVWRRQWDDCLKMPMELELMLDEVNRVRTTYKKIEKFKERREL